MVLDGFFYILLTIFNQDLRKLHKKSTTKKSRKNQEKIPNLIPKYPDLIKQLRNKK
jgi:hypothetical protein